MVFSTTEPYPEGGDPGPMTSITESRSGGPDYDNDVYVILAIAAVLTLVWALAASLNGNPGFTVLAIAMPATRRTVRDLRPRGRAPDLVGRRLRRAGGAAPGAGRAQAAAREEAKH